MTTVQEIKKAVENLPKSRLAEITEHWRFKEKKVWFWIGSHSEYDRLVQD